VASEIRSLVLHLAQHVGCDNVLLRWVVGPAPDDGFPLASSRHFRAIAASYCEWNRHCVARESMAARQKSGERRWIFPNKPSTSTALASSVARVPHTPSLTRSILQPFPPAQEAPGLELSVLAGVRDRPGRLSILCTCDPATRTHRIRGRSTGRDGRGVDERTILPGTASQV
jgi:hypothetical protein